MSIGARGKVVLVACVSADGAEIAADLSRSSDGGVTWSEPVHLVTPDTDQIVIAVALDGSAVVTGVCRTADPGGTCKPTSPLLVRDAARLDGADAGKDDASRADGGAASASRVALRAVPASAPSSPARRSRPSSARTGAPPTSSAAAARTTASRCSSRTTAASRSRRARSSPPSSRAPAPREGRGGRPRRGRAGGDVRHRREQRPPPGRRRHPRVDGGPLRGGSRLPHHRRRRPRPAGGGPAPRRRGQPARGRAHRIRSARARAPLYLAGDGTSGTFWESPRRRRQLGQRPCAASAGAGVRPRPEHQRRLLGRGLPDGGDRLARRLGQHRRGGRCRAVGRGARPRPRPPCSRPSSATWRRAPSGRASRTSSSAPRRWSPRCPR